MLKGLNSTFKKVIFLTPWKVLYFINDVIIWLKMGIRNGFFSTFGINVSLMEYALVSKGLGVLYQLKVTIINCSHSNSRIVNRRIVLLKLYFLRRLIELCSLNGLRSDPKHIPLIVCSSIIRILSASLKTEATNFPAEGTIFGGGYSTAVINKALPATLKICQPPFNGSIWRRILSLFCTRISMNSLRY